jgi:hypothetical protein
MAASINPDRLSTLTAEQRSKMQKRLMIRHYKSILEPNEK